MRYTEEMYQEFLGRLLSMILEEHNRIGLATEKWKSSFQLLTPDFQKKENLILTIFWQKRQFWNLLKRSYLKCRNFSETNSN